MSHIRNVAAATLLGIAASMVVVTPAFAQDNTTPATAQPAPECTPDFMMQLLQNNGGTSEVVNRALHAMAARGEGDSWPAVATVYGNSMVNAAISNRVCVKPVSLADRLIAYSGVGGQPFPRTQAQVQAEQATAEAERAAEEARLREAQARQRRAAGQLQGTSMTRDPAAERTARAARNEVASLRTSVQELTTKVARLEQERVTMAQVTAAIDDRFDPESDSFFLKDEKVVAAMVAALQPTFDTRYERRNDDNPIIRKNDMVDRDRRLLAVECETDLATEEACAALQSDESDTGSLPWLLIITLIVLLFVLAAFLRGWWPFGRSEEAEGEDLSRDRAPSAGRDEEAEQPFGQDGQRSQGDNDEDEQQRQD